MLQLLSDTLCMKGPERFLVSDFCFVAPTGVSFPPRELGAEGFFQTWSFPRRAFFQSSCRSHKCTSRIPGILGSSEWALLVRHT